MLRASRVAKGIGVLTVAAAILSLTAEGASGAGGAKIFLISGKGDVAQSTSISSNGRNTSLCTKLRYAVATASISNGTAGNTMHVEARCGTTPIAQVTAQDPGGGAVDFDHNEVELVPPGATGTPNCFRDYEEVAATPDSTWTITCVFLFD